MRETVAWVREILEGNVILTDYNWVDLPIIRTQKFPIYIDRQCPAASCEIRLMPTPMSRNGGNFPGVLRSVDRRARPPSTSGTVVAFSLACLVKRYLIIRKRSDE
jgi:hypothetical protein